MLQRQPGKASALRVLPLEGMLVLLVPAQALAHGKLHSASVDRFASSLIVFHKASCLSIRQLCCPCAPVIMQAESLLLICNAKRAEGAFHRPEAARFACNESCSLAGLPATLLARRKAYIDLSTLQPHSRFSTMSAGSSSCCTAPTCAKAMRHFVENAAW